MTPHELEEYHGWIGHLASLDNAYATAAIEWMEAEGWPVLRRRLKLRLRVGGRTRNVILGPTKLGNRIAVMDGRRSIRSLVLRPAAKVLQFPRQAGEGSR